EMPKLGWQAEILAPGASYQPASCRDDDGAAFFAPDVQAHHVGEILPKVFRAAGLGTIGWRALLPMARRGAKLLASKQFDLVYISTAQLPLFLLGPLWRRSIGVPYVLDLHDPGHRDRHERPPWLRSSLKHEMGRRLATYVESHAVAQAAGVVSVSAAYLDDLRRRHARTKGPWLHATRTAVIPFAVRPEDLSEAARNMPCRDVERRSRARIAYVGAGGPVMARAFGVLCRTLARLQRNRPDLAKNVTIALSGTMLGWRDGERCHLVEIAREHGLGHIVEEDPRRLSYRRSLEELVGSNGVLILGADDRGYMPSKLFSYALSGKPLLACVHRDGPGCATLRRDPSLGHVLWFSETDDMGLDEAADVVGAFIDEVIARRTFERAAALRPFFAQSMAEQHVALFEACLSASPRPYGIALPATDPVRA
ncbi:MAG: glycosyltransferase, partial [Xanthobacteraceae bacterium]|nr:glycosyltransferase [Xanthobacteraceae bacterium]